MTKRYLIKVFIIMNFFYFLLYIFFIFTCVCDQTQKKWQKCFYKKEKKSLSLFFIFNFIIFFKYQPFTIFSCKNVLCVVNVYYLKKHTKFLKVQLRKKKNFEIFLRIIFFLFYRLPLKRSKHIQVFWLVHTKKNSISGDWLSFFRK